MPLKFAEAKLFFFLLPLLVVGVVSFVVVVEEKVESRKEEMVDLQRVDSEDLSPKWVGGIGFWVSSISYALP
jgi:hypothetical protein